MTVNINHPDTFKSGTRVLMLTGRNKDGITKKRKILRVSNNSEEFDRHLEQLTTILLPGERIYSSIDERDVAAAARMFKHRQIDAEFNTNPLSFYENIMDRWISCLMAPTSRKEKNWLFDCDSEEEYVFVMENLKEYYDRGYLYEYDTKNGKHVIVLPFNRGLLGLKVRDMIKDNPFMLWAY